MPGRARAIRSSGHRPAQPGDPASGPAGFPSRGGDRVRLRPVQSKARTVAEYLASLPPDRRAALQAVRKVITANLDPAYVECMQYGMIGYAVPHSVYPAGYHCDASQPLPFAHLASQKNHMALYLMCVYLAPEQLEWFRAAWKTTGKRLDMGKSCVRFTSADDLALDVIGQAVRRVPARKFIARYEALLAGAGRRRTPGGKSRGKSGDQAGCQPRGRSKSAAPRGARA